MNRTPKRLLVLSCIIWFCYGFLCTPCQILAKENSSTLPTTVRLVLAKAGKMVENKDFDKAISLLTTFQEKAPANCRDEEVSHHPQVSYYLGFCYLMQNRYEEARRALEHTVERDAQHLSGWLNLAKACYELHDYPRAAECFTKAYTLDPKKNPELLYYGAVAHLLAEQHKQSIAVFEKIIANHPNKMEPYWRENLVHALLSADRARLALVHIKLLIAGYEGEKKIRWQEILLQQYVLLDMGKEALAYAHTLTEQAPTQPKWWKALASLYLQKENYKPALTALVIDSYLEPLSAEESKLVADLYLQLGIPGKAAARYQDILHANNSPRLVERLVLALRQLGETERALAVLDKFAATTMTPSLLMQKADLLYELGKYQQAAELYTRTAKKEGRQKDRALQMAEYAMLQASYMDNNNRAKHEVTF
ncbi:tetratricopeptide repeat protein [Desulforhopalus sp. 52FAK]